MEANTSAVSGKAKRKRWSKDDPRLGRAAQNRLMILEAAKAIFLADGYAAASMDRIAVQAGVSKMTLYRHFKDKGALFIETINQKCGEIYQFTSHEPAEARADAEADLRRFGAAFIDVVTAPDVLGLYQMLLGEMRRFPDLGRMFFDIVIAHSLEAIERILSRVVPPDDLGWRAREFMHLVMGDGYQRLSLGKLHYSECREQCLEQTRRAARLVLTGID